ncbi:HNH endonuclease [Chryseobacterium sp. ON_d1]|uniref:HNH endonuclease n=1 Tax=Chryseobacterium sp. ON_d1 TaxID=2583211 RepID=UPI00115A8D9A|nr:hypothetical protein CRS_42100 [Chryseobacterium sp. ON_d1]
MRIDPLRNKIQKSYLWKTVDRNIIRSYPLTSHNDWTNLNYRYQPIKNRIKDHYSIEQRDHCVYCRQKINFKGYDEPIEHIIPKEARYDLMFTPLNLCLSCRTCNTKKSTNSPLSNRFRNNLSLNYDIYTSTHFRILHPHFDNFHDYVFIDDGLFYRSYNRDKGLLHIYFFDLNSPTKIIDLARDQKIDKFNFHKKLTHKMRDPSLSQKQKRRIREILLEVIDRRPL